MSRPITGSGTGPGCTSALRWPVTPMVVARVPPLRLLLLPAVLPPRLVADGTAAFTLFAKLPTFSRPPDPPVDGDAATDFTSSTVWQLEGLVVRRVKVMARDPLLAGHVDSTTVQRRWGW